MSRKVFLNVVFLFATAAVMAGYTPQIMNCGVTPVTIHPGQAFTIYADVADADGSDDLSAVSLVYDSTSIFTLPKSQKPGRYEVTFDMPANAPETTLVLGVAATDQAGTVSPQLHFALSILGSPGVELIEPEDGTNIPCEGMTSFSWQPYGGDFDAFAFAFYTTDGAELIVPLPKFMTQFNIPGELWRWLPDGTYYWKVGVFHGQEASEWSELRSFVVECNDPFPDRVFGRVIATDPELRTISIASEWHRGPETVTVQVTEETVITGHDGQELAFEDIEAGNFAMCVGHYEDTLFFAIRVVVDTWEGPDPQDQVAGIILQIDPDAQTFLVQRNHHDNEENGPGSVLVTVSDETLFFDQEGIPITFADLAVEMHTLVIGEWVGDVFAAREVYVREGHHEHGDRVHGQIISIDPKDMILVIGCEENPGENQIQVQITEETRINSDQGPMTFDQLEIGMMVEAMGRYSEETGMFVAEELFVRTGHGPDPQDHVAGIVTVIDPELWTIVVEGNCEEHGPVTIQITEETLILDQTGPVGFDAIQVGMFVHAEGRFDESNVFVATELFINNQPPDPEEFIHGEVTAIDAEASMIYLNENIQVIVTEETVLMTHMGPITFDQIQIGMMAHAHGTPGEGGFTATEIFFDDGHGPHPDPAVVAGAILELIPEQMQLVVGHRTLDHGSESVIVQVTWDTIIQNEMGEQLAYENLEIGSHVFCEGEFSEDIFTAGMILVGGHH